MTSHAIDPDPSGPRASERSRNKKRAAIFAGALVLLAGAGIALAAYLSSASGDGVAQSTTAIDSVIAPAEYGPELYPGNTTDILVAITNPNPYPVRVTSISDGTSDAVGGCPAGSVTTAAVPNPPTTVIAPGGFEEYRLLATMIDNPDNACQDQIFYLPLTAQLESAV